jgi:integrase
MRISEPLRLKLHHFRTDDNTLYIEKTKFKKDRLIPIPKAVAAEITNYLAVRRMLWGTDDANAYLLAISKEKPFYDDFIRRRFHQAVGDIGLKCPRKTIGNTNIGAPTPHCLRHYAEFRIMPSNIPQPGGSLAVWLILLGIIRDF